MSDMKEEARKRLQMKLQKFQERKKLLEEKRVRLDEQTQQAQAAVEEASARAKDLTGTDDLSIIDGQIAEVYASLEQMLLEAEAVFTKAGV